MKKLKCRATLSYAYNLGDTVVQNVTNSNFIQPELREVNIRVRKFANTTYFKPGDIITYTIVLSNEGTYEANEVLVAEELVHQSLIKSSIKIRALDEPVFSYKEGVSEVLITLGTLAPQNTIYITYQTIVDEIVDINFDIKSTSKVTTGDYIVDVNTVEIMQRYAKLLCEKKSDSVIYPNKQFAMELVIENIGNEKAVDLDLVDQLPERYCLDEVYLDNELLTDYTIEGNHLKFIVGEIAPFSSRNVTIIGLIKKNI